MTHIKRCLLAGYCRNPEQCTDISPHYIAIHGLNGEGGRIAAANIPRDYRYITLANSPVRESQSKIYDLLEKYVETFAGKERIKSLYLWSESPGTGKTTTASALANEYIIRNYLSALKAGEQPTQMPAYFLDVNEWQTDYNEFNRPRVPEPIAEKAAAKYYRAMEKAKEAPFAILDDIGVREASEGFRGDLHAIINYRVTNELPTVYTSNLPVEDMARVFDARLYDRIRDMTGVIEFAGGSKRGRR